MTRAWHSLTAWCEAPPTWAGRMVDGHVYSLGGRPRREVVILQDRLRHGVESADLRLTIYSGGGLTTDGVSECYSGLQVRCPNSERCVSPYWICDGAPDCPDGEDEVGCDKTPCDGFRCWDDTCVAAAWRCDGQRDCQDGDDEYACPHCGSEELRCPRGGACLSHNATCDGVYHCQDGWDESGAVCGSRSCGPNELRCLEGGRCVDHQRLCDGVPDCPTSEDEDDTFCAAFRSVKSITTTAAATASNSTTGYEGLPVQCERGSSDVEVNCTHQEFRCDSGKCIRRLYLCNGIDDCKNGEDERPTLCAPPLPEVAKDHSRTYDSEEDVGDVYEYTGTNEEDLESEGVDVAAPCQDGRLRCDEEPLCDEEQQLGCAKPSQNSSLGSTDHGENTTRSVNNDSLTVDNSTPSGNQTWSTSEGIDQSLDYSNSLFPYYKHQGPLLGITISNNSFEFLDDAGVSNLNVTEDNDGLSNGTLRNDSDVNTVSRTQSTVDREAITLDSVDVSNEIVFEESFYPNSSERELDTASVEDYEDIREANGPVSLNASLLFISHNLTNATTTDNTTSVMDTPNDLDLNSTMPNLTTDGTVNNISNDYESSSSSSSSYFSEEYSVSDEIISLPSPVLTASDSNDTEEVDTGSTQLDEDSIVSTEEEDRDELFNITTLTPSDKEMITDHPSVINTPPDNETTVTPMLYDSVSSEVSPAGYTPPEAEETTEAFTATETQSSAVSVGNATTPVPSDDVDDNSDVGIWATTTTATTISEVTDQATEDAPTTTSAATTSTNALTTTTTTSTSTATTTTVTTFPPSTYREDPTTETLTEDVTTDATQTPTEHQEGRSISTTHSPSRETGGPSADGTELVTTTSSFTTESNNWKDAAVNQKNLTILIAIHSEMNESKVPEYIIQGMDGRPYQYEIVSIVKDDELAPDNLEADKTSNMLREEEADGSHEYLQGNNISSAKRCTLSLISLILMLFLHKL
ncbi:uncharacterized protein [Panulirus ornatus]|uniref:uncharacterized protein isoform X2 n=1 Tax=Panulirus ornatus TaxID=150431 RepID=UPI003A8A5756